MAGSVAARAAPLPWVFGLSERVHVSPVVVGIGFTTAYLVTALAYYNLTGILDGLSARGRPFWAEPLLRMDVSYALIGGYVIAAVGVLLRNAGLLLEQLRPVLRLDAEAFAAQQRSVVDPPRGPLRVAALVGVVLALFLAGSFEAELGEAVRVTPWTAWVVWGLARELVVDVIGLQGLVALWSAARRFSRVAEQHARIDLFDLRPLAPSARLGLQLALFWLIATALVLTAYASIDLAEFGPVSGATNLVATLGIFALTAIPFTLPVLGLRRAIQREKDGELARVRAAMARERAAALDRRGEGSLEATLRLPGLLAYEQRVAGVREWPFDLPMLGRLFLYLLIPLVSWTAAAFVERLLGMALD